MKLDLKVIIVRADEGAITRERKWLYSNDHWLMVTI